MTEESHVTYSVKELIERLEGATLDGFRRLESRLDDLARSVSSKADSEHVKLIEDRLRLVEDRLGSTLAVEKYKKWLIGITIGVVSLAVAVAGIILT